MAACLDCKWHLTPEVFAADYRTGKKRTENSGLCMRNPISTPVADRHYCGDFQPAFGWGRTNDDTYKLHNDDTNYWRKRAQEAERKLKKANERVKVLRSRGAKP